MIWLALIARVHAGDVLINEVLYDPEGSDGGIEWIELCNSGTTTVDLTGWSIESAGSAWDESYTFTARSLGPGERLVIGGAAGGTPATFSPNLQNGGSESDGIRLLDDVGAVQDTVIYDSPNDNGLQDDQGVATSFAADAAEGQALARVPDCADTDASGVDFAVTATPTPGEENVGGGGGTADCTGRADVVINEVVSNAPGADEGFEWIELLNTGSAPVALEGWVIEWGTSSWSSSAVLPAASLSPGAFVVVGGASVPEAAITVDLGLGNASTSADGVRLVCGDTAADTVIYGGSNTDGWIDDQGVATSLAPVPAEGESIGRATDGVDTDRSGDDFIVFDAPTPGSGNEAGPAECAGAFDVKINEFMPDPPGSDDGLEWVELYNRSSVAVSLDGWSLEWGTGSWSQDGSFGSTDSIGPGEVLLVGSALVGADVEMDLDLGNASSSGDGVRLVHCAGGAADTVIYGPNNDDGFEDDAGKPATSLAPQPGDSLSIARVDNGVDSDRSGLDFALGTPSPGAPNPVVEPITCSPGDGGIVINEVLPDPDGTDDGYEWVELYNKGSLAQRLDGWTLLTATGDTWSEDFAFPGGVEILPGAFVVIGGVGVPELSFLAEGLSLGNASRTPDGVMLGDCEGNVQDTVLYGDPSAEAEDPLEDDQGGSSFAPMPDSDRSFGRIPDGEDSDDSSVDFATNLDPTPGAANALAEGVEGPGGKGCGKGSDDPSKKCGLPIQASLAQVMLLALFAAIRRRR